jgi:hypothetical protein
MREKSTLVNFAGQQVTKGEEYDAAYWDVYAYASMYIGARTEEAKAKKPLDQKILDKVDAIMTPVPLEHTMEGKLQATFTPVKMTLGTPQPKVIARQQRVALGDEDDEYCYDLHFMCSHVFPQR